MQCINIYFDFLDNVITDAFGVSIGKNANLNPEDIDEVLAGATHDRNLTPTLCERSTDGSSGTDTLLHQKLDSKQLNIIIVILQKYTSAPLKQVEVVVNLHL